MANLTSSSCDRFSARSAHHYERHRSASSLNKRIDPIVRCVELDYTTELGEILESSAERFTLPHLDAALLRGAQLGKAKACSLLIKHGANINALESPAKHEERFGKARAVFSVNQAAKDRWQASHSSVGGTCLHLAVEGGHVDVVRMLIARNACVNIIDNLGRSPLILACMKRGTSNIVCTLLLGKDVDVSLKDVKNGRNALHYAALLGDSENLQHLLTAGAKVDDYDSDHNTPLILTCSPESYTNPTWPPRETLECVQLLISNGAFINIFNNQEESALSLSVKSGEVEVVQFLMENSALLQKEIVKDVCLQYKDSLMLSVLLEGGHSLEDEYLCAILLAAVNTMVSPWSLNNKEQEENTHNLARVLIKSINETQVYSELAAISYPELIRLFGDELLSQFNEKDHTDLQSYGFLGYVLKRNKFSIARMLYIVGCRDKLHSLKENPKATELISSHPYLNKWLAPALEEAVPDNTMLDLIGYDSDALDAVSAYDASVQGEQLIDTAYVRREDARAITAQGFTVYDE